MGEYYTDAGLTPGPLNTHPYFDPPCIVCGCDGMTQQIMVTLRSNGLGEELYWCSECGAVCEVTLEDTLKIEWTVPEQTRRNFHVVNTDS